MKSRCLAAFLVIAGGTPAFAESELQKFQQSLAPDSRYEFAIYQACALSALIDAQHDGKTLAEAESAVAALCKKYIYEADRALAAKGVPSETRTRTIAEFECLAASERALTFQGKPVPGYELDAWGTKTAKCLDTQKAYEAISACFRAHAEPLISTSRELPSDIATAVESSCHTPLAALELQMVPCLGIAEARQAIAPYRQSLRDAVIAAVVRARTTPRQKPP